MRRRGFVFGDVHFPFHHKVILPLALWYCIRYKPDYIVQIGDIKDQYSASKFPRSYNLYTPRDEDKYSQYYSELFWAFLNQYLVNTEKYQIIGNHDIRPVKRVLEKAPEFETDLLEVFKEKYEFDGVKTIFDDREELIIDDVVYMHGYLTRGGAHAQFNKQNFVCGHTHRGGTWFFPMDGHELKQYWELNAGYLANPHAEALKYTAQKKATNWTHGIGTVDLHGPRFVPLYQQMADNIKDDVLFQELHKAFT